MREREGEELHETLKQLADDGEMLAREGRATMGRAMHTPPPAIGRFMAPGATFAWPAQRSRRRDGVRAAVTAFTQL